MAKVRMAGFAMSLDGFGAGLKQALDLPLGIDFDAAFEWFFRTRTFHAMQKMEGGETGVDDSFAARGFQNVGAWIMGRNMFGPVRGPWPDESWRGWWGENPPFHVPVFVLTHHPRAELSMEGGTTFHFVTGGVQQALTLATAAAGGKDVRVGGGVSTARQFLAAKLVDEAHLAVADVFLGRGESLFAGLDMKALGYSLKDLQRGERATHLLIERA